MRGIIANEITISKQFSHSVSMIPSISRTTSIIVNIINNIISILSLLSLIYFEVLIILNITSNTQSVA